MLKPQQNHEMFTTYQLVRDSILYFFEYHHQMLGSQSKCLVQHGSTWFNMVQHGSTWFNMVQHGSTGYIIPFFFRSYNGS